MSVQWMDCTLRDGANIVGKGFDEKVTRIILEGLTAAKAPYIEMGHALGLGGYASGAHNALPDEDYFSIAKDFIGRSSEIGMFFNARRGRESDAEKASAAGLSFLRVGIEAGCGAQGAKAVQIVKKAGLQAFYSQMKAYLLTPEQLAEEARMLEDAGADEITVMDSAGTLTPDQTAEYIEKLTAAVSIPVGFHGHNNLGLSTANALAAKKHGASILDCSLMGMARSAGNVPSEVCLALMQRAGEMMDIPLFPLLHWIENTLQPTMEEYGYHNPLPPMEMIMGIAGCHSSNLPLLREVSMEQGVDLMAFIIEVSRINRGTVSRAEALEIAAKMM